MKYDKLRIVLYGSFLVLSACFLEGSWPPSTTLLFALGLFCAADGAVRTLVAWREFQKARVVRATNAIRGAGFCLTYALLHKHAEDFQVQLRGNGLEVTHTFTQAFVGSASGAAFLRHLCLAGEAALVATGVLPRFGSPVARIVRSGAIWRTVEEGRDRWESLALRVVQDQTPNCPEQGQIESIEGISDYIAAMDVSDRLDALFEHDLDLVVEFLTVNRPLLEQLTNEIQRKRHLNRDTLAGFLARAQLTPRAESLVPDFGT